jgi:Asp/Glu/hydantoin racemase
MTPIRVLLINPVGTDYMLASLRELIGRSGLAGIDVDVEYLAEGVPPTAFLPLPNVSYNQILTAAAGAGARGYDAVVVSCAADPAVAVAKTISPIPVTGPMEAALHTAAALGGRLGVVTAKLAPGPNEHQPSTVNWLRELIQNYGMWHRFAGVRSVHPEHPVGDEAEDMLRDDPAGLRAAIQRGMAEAVAGPGVKLAIELVEEDDATAISFACTQWGGLLGPVRDAVDVPVIDPVVDTIRYAALLATIGRP